MSSGDTAAETGETVGGCNFNYSRPGDHRGDGSSLTTVDNVTGITDATLTDDKSDNENYETGARQRCCMTNRSSVDTAVECDTRGNLGRHTDPPVVGGGKLSREVDMLTDRPGQVCVVATIPGRVIETCGTSGNVRPIRAAEAAAETVRLVSDSELSSDDVDDRDRRRAGSALADGRDDANPVINA